MSKWLCVKKNKNVQYEQSKISEKVPSSSLVSSLTEEHLNDEINTSSDTTFINDTTTLDGLNYVTKSDDDTNLESKAKIREKAVSKVLNNIKLSMEVDLCFVLDCTVSMEPCIAAAKDCMIQVLNYVRQINPSIKLRVGFCGYRDYGDSCRLQVFDFTNQYGNFTSYLFGIKADGGGDGPEDVLGGLNAAITKLNWRNRTRVILHICDFPPHGLRYSNMGDSYPKGDPSGLTAENVLKKMKSRNILYFFGRITSHTEKMLQIFRSIIGEFPVFDVIGGDPTELIDKFCKATSSSITMAISLTSTVGTNHKDVYDLQQKKFEINPNEPDWNVLPSHKGVSMWYNIPVNLDELKSVNYFSKSNLFSESFSFKLAPNPFSAGVERYAYYAINTEGSLEKKLVIKEYHYVGQEDPFEKYLEAVEVSTIAYFLSTKFNLIAEQKEIKKVKFINAKLLRTGTVDPCSTKYYTIEPKLEGGEYKRFNSNTGVITEFHSTLEAFAHYTYEYTRGYLVVYDLQGIELSNEFLLTDPAIHCADTLRFGKTNFGKRGIDQCFLKNHRCNDICKKLKLSKISIVDNNNSRPLIKKFLCIS